MRCADCDDNNLAGGFSFELSEGDIICVMSQWGEVEDINLVRDKETNKSRGFAFIKYEDQRSTILAVDNFNGIKLLGRLVGSLEDTGYSAVSMPCCLDEALSFLPSFSKGGVCDATTSMNISYPRMYAQKRWSCYNRRRVPTM